MSSLGFNASFPLILEERRIAFGASWRRKVRTPQGTMPRNSDCFGWRYTRAERQNVLTDSATENIPPAVRLRRDRQVRVKRWCKRPPRRAQAKRHGKPHRVQGQIGKLRSGSLPCGEIRRVSGMAAQTNGSLHSQERRQNSAYSSSKITTFLRRSTQLRESSQAPFCRRALQLKSSPYENLPASSRFPPRSGVFFAPLCF